MTKKQITVDSSHGEIIEQGKVIYETQRNRESGTHTGVVDLRKVNAKLHAVPTHELTVKYAVACFTHGITLQTEKRLPSEELSHHPTQWCTECAKAGSSKRRAESVPSKVEVTRDDLRTVYMHVVHNWACGQDEIVAATELDKKVVLKALKMLNAERLVEGTHVNDAKELTWQSYFDVENEQNVTRKAGRAFNKAFPAQKA